jgi:hypothetical protein
VLLPGLGIVPLLVGMLAGAAGGLLALRVLAPGTIEDLLEQVRLMRGGRDAPPDETRPEPPVPAGTR